VITPRSRLRSLVIWLGISVAIAGAVIVPAGYFWMAYTALQHELAFSARLNATTLARYIDDNKVLWPFQAQRLSQFIEAARTDEGATQQRILDASGKLLLETGPTPTSPVVTFSAPLVVDGSPVGAVETAASLRKELIETGFVAVLSSLVSFSIFLALRFLPLRAIDRVLGELETVQVRYRLLFDASPFPTVVIDRATRQLLDVNEATVRHYGWSREELLSMTSNDLYPPEDRSAVSAARERFLAEATPVVPPLRHRTKDGTIIDVEQTVHPIEFAGRAAILVTAHDVTERNRAMKELGSSEEKYHALIESLPVGVLETTADGFIVTANSAWRRMFGFGETEDLSALDVQTLYANPQERRAVVETLGSGRATPAIEAMFRRRDGTVFPVERYVRSVLNAEGEIVGLRGIVIDITQRKSLEAQLNQALKMEAIGQLTGGIAHDLNNIMMIILANTDALLDAADLANSHQKRIGRIATASEKAADLTRSLLAFSHKLPLNPRRTDLNALVRSTGKLLRRTLAAEVEIDSVLAADLWPVEVDPGQFENALVNLCVNARDAMHTGGRLTIETANVVVDEYHAAEFADASPGAYVRLAVSDTGTGIDPEVLPRVFEPFFTTKEVGKGTGLGLSMVHGFIKQSNGHIEIQSKLGRGTTIKIYLPRSTKGAAADLPPSTAALPGGREEILVVEDEPRVREAVVDQLESLGYSVTAAADGAAGLAAFEMAIQPYDLLLTDVVMPGIDGKALADEVVRRWPRTPVLFMSGYSHDSIIHEGRLDTDAELLAKPFGKGDLAQAVRHMLDDAKNAKGKQSA
jgi:PAS domain S-box-containing protein